jgi:Domain of unknown function (DUF4129)
MDVRWGVRGRSGWLLVLLVIAITLGAAAALLAGPAPPFAPVAPAAGSPVPYALLGQIFGWAVIAGIVLWLANHIYQRRRSGAAAMPSRAVATFVVVFVLLVGFILLGRSGLLPVSPIETGPAPPGGNTSSGGSTPAGGAGNNSSLPAGFGSLKFGQVAVPGWLLYAGLLGAVVVALAVVVPLYLSVRRASSGAARDDEVGRARRDLSEALAQLDEGETADPRTVIVRLYARLLGRLRPGLDRLDAMAPREIETHCADRLGIQRETARALTRLFEEARYSRHPLPPATLDAARQAFGRAIADLDRFSGIP